MRTAAADLQLRPAKPVLGMDQIVSNLSSVGLLNQPVTDTRAARLVIGGRTVLNFASAHYLGHDLHRDTPRILFQAAKQWGLSLGMPRLFAEDQWTTRLEKLLAQLTGQQAALLFPSTTHLALDALALMAGSRGTLLLDEWAYPISVQAARAAQAQGTRLVTFRHNNMASLESALRAEAHRAARVIVVDGVYSAGYQTALLDDIYALSKQYNAQIYVDDAHGIGVLGRHPDARNPYGLGGAGTPAYFGIPPGRILYAASLSKAFGVPLAFAAGPHQVIHKLRVRGGSILHSSPPAIPLVVAACAVLQAHAVCGNELRQRLLRRVHQFRAALPVRGEHAFPIQTLFFPGSKEAYRAALFLRRQGIWTTVQFHPPELPQGGAVRFLLTADHQEADIQRVIDLLRSTSNYSLSR